MCVCVCVCVYVLIASVFIAVACIYLSIIIEQNVQYNNVSFPSLQYVCYELCVQHYRM